MKQTKMTEKKMTLRRSLLRNKTVMNNYDTNNNNNTSKTVAKEKNNSGNNHHQNSNTSNTTGPTTYINPSNTTTTNTTNTNIPITSNTNNIASETKIHSLIPGFYDETNSTVLQEKNSEKIEPQLKARNNRPVTDDKCKDLIETSPPSRSIVLSNAARTFDVLQHPDDWTNSLKPFFDKNQSTTGDLLNLSEMNDQEMRLIFDLAYCTLKYQNILSDLLRRCRFYGLFPELMSEHSTVMVVLYDMMREKFEELHSKGKETKTMINEIEAAIYSCKIKLNALLARNRIKINAMSLDYLLPEQVRVKDKISSQMNAYIWVNLVKTSIDDVIAVFSDEGFILTTGIMEHGKKVFARDRHCFDLLAFPPTWKLYLRQHQLFKDGHIILQDKSSCIAPLSVVPLIQDGDEVMHVNIGSGLTTAHLASLLCSINGRIWGLVDAKNFNSAQKNLEHLNIKHVKLLTDSFLSVSPDDQKFKGVKIILLTANCSKSALNNPVDFVINEGEDISILKTLSRDGVSKEELEGLCKEQRNYLNHSLLFPNVKSVVYLTRSINSKENEVTVAKALEYVNTRFQSHGTFYNVVPPVLPFNRDDIENKIGLQDKYTKFEPSASMNGCFLAIIAQGGELKKFQKGIPMLQHPKVSNKDSTRKKRITTSVNSKKATPGLPLEISRLHSQRRNSQQVAREISRADSLFNNRLAEHRKIVIHPKPFR